MQLAAGMHYILTKLPCSRDGVRFFGAVTDSMESFGVNTFFGGELKPIRKLAKEWDGLFYLKEVIQTLFDASHLDLQKVREKNRVEIFNRGVKSIKTVCGALKWLGGVSAIMVLSKRMQSFKYVKNGCSLYFGFFGVIKNGIKISKIYHSPEEKEKKKEIAKATAAVIMSICSIWINGVGGLNSYMSTVGFSEKKWEIVQPWTLRAATLISTSIAVTKNILTEPASEK